MRRLIILFSYIFNKKKAIIMSKRQKTSQTISNTQASIIHQKEGKDCEDVVLCYENKDYRFYGVADGQSGKLYSKQGGECTLKTVCEYIKSKGVHNLAKLENADEIRYEIIKEIRRKIGELSSMKKANISEFASTLVVLAVDKRSGEYITVHLGDGGIIGKKKDATIILISAPENGITSRYTWLTTSSDALMHLRIGFGKISNYSQIILFSDGANTLCCGANITLRASKALKQNANPQCIAELIEESCSDDVGYVIANF